MNITSLIGSHRYLSLSALDRTLILILGPAGAILMAVSAVVGVLLLLGRGSGAPARNAGLLCGVAAFLALTRMSLRGVLMGAPLPELSWSFVGAAALGSIALGIPCAVVGSILGRYAGEALLGTMRASLEAACHSRQLAIPITLFRDALMALTVVGFGVYPAVAVAMSVFIGAGTGACLAIQKGLGEKLMTDEALGVQMVRSAVAVIILGFILADGGTSF